jgi:hypothetical protein
MQSFRGRKGYHTSGGTDPEAVGRILDEAFRRAADQIAGRSRAPEPDLASLLPDDLAADPDATVRAIAEFNAQRIAKNR